MKLTDIQINQIIEGLENCNNRLEAKSIFTLNITNIIHKLKNGKYKNKFFGFKIERKSYSIKTKEELLRGLKIDNRHTLELIITNIDKTETRITI